MSKLDPTNDRHLVVWEGSESALILFFKLRVYYPGDWIGVSSSTITHNTIKPTQAKSLLGQEFLHGFFDARAGFNLDAFLILSGSLIKGSILLLLLPENMESSVDEDTLRWNDTETPITTPNFAAHLKAVLKKHGISIFPVHPSTCIDDVINRQNPLFSGLRGEGLYSLLTPTVEQQTILAELKHTTASIVTLTAKRGRGKSALAGFFSRHNNCWICAPNGGAVRILLKFAKPGLTVWAPDALLKHLELGNTPPDWLIIDECATIPLPILDSLIHYSKRLMLLTTTDGYEGTGQGFMLRLFSHKQDVRHCVLTKPIRWMSNDPLENIIDDLLFESKHEMVKEEMGEYSSVGIKSLTPSELIQNTTQLTQLYQLLKRAHYKTTPTDLRRLLDAEKTGIVSAMSGTKPVGIGLFIREGNLNKELSEAVWSGIRRPRGNLVAQSLAAHAGDVAAARLSSVRIQRVAVENEFRRRGIGRRIICSIIDRTCEQNCDFVSTSFGYHPETYAFWISCGFELVHVGSHRDACNGAYTLMMMKSLRPSASAMKKRLQNRLKRNGYWIYRMTQLPIFDDLTPDHELNDEDWRELSGFAFARRSYPSTYPVLCRLKQNPETTKANRLLFSLTQDSVKMEKMGFNGKKAYIAALRDEIKILLNQRGIYSPLFPEKTTR